MNKYVERLYNGIWKENPIFVQMLGLCPTLAVTTSAINGVGMGLSTTAVLIAANFLIALLRKILRNHRRYVDGRFRSKLICFPGTLHSADRS